MGPALHGGCDLTIQDGWERVFRGLAPQYKRNSALAWRTTMR